MEHHPGVKFITALQDLNQPYSCSQWGNAGVNGIPVIVEHDGTIFNWLHDSWNAMPTYALIDHTMTVRAKPWSYQNNSNTSNCDGSNSSVSGWSGGNTNDFLQQLVDECGDLCSGESCSTAPGDVNEDENLNIQDIITMVNHILSVTPLEGCALDAADMNTDGIINIQDLISLVNAILGNARSAQLNGSAQIDYLISGNDLIVQINSSVDLAGVQFSILNDLPIKIDLKENSHITQDSYFKNGVNKYLAYSINNQNFESNRAEFILKDAKALEIDNIHLTISDINGDALFLSQSEGGDGPIKFEMDELYPNPFNPSTQISFSIAKDSFIKLSAYNVMGHEVDVIYEGLQRAGRHNYKWNASNLPSGVYYVKLQSNNLISSQKALLIK